MAFDPLGDAYRNKVFFRAIFGGFSGAAPLFWITGVIVGEAPVSNWPLAIVTPVGGFLAGWMLDILWDKSGEDLMERIQND